VIHADITAPILSCRVPRWLSLHRFLPGLIQFHIFSDQDFIMKTPLKALFSGWLVISHLLLSAALPNCPLGGPEFPPPQRLSQHPKWKQALADVNSVFDYIDVGGTGGVDSLSYSVQVFSTNPGGGILGERHHTASNLAEDTPGVKHVDGDTVYRLGSVSKVFAVLAWLAELGDVHWNQPIIDFIPELASLSAQAASKPFDSVRQTAWEDVTIGSLASQVSGLGRDCMKFHASSDTFN
jgi:hypothetical protein